QGDPLLDREFGGAEFDLLSDVGFLNALYHASPLEEGGGMMLAPVCGTFESRKHFEKRCKTTWQRYWWCSRWDDLGVSSIDFSTHCDMPRCLVGSDAIEKLSQFHSRRNLRQRGMVRRYVDGSGKWRVQGGSQLKASQAYPAGFGRALASRRTLALKKQRRFARSFLKRAHESRGSLMDERPRANAKWVKGADLKPIITYLSQRQ
ncbi:unnamed protein product, partial [Durusdinium trenchii]